MAYTVKQFLLDRDEVENTVKTYLDDNAPTTIHSIDHSIVGSGKVSILIVWE